jgi:hypothetical protein
MRCAPGFRLSPKSSHNSLTSYPADTPQDLSRVILWTLMPTEPAVKRTIAFIDGQNLFYDARAAFDACIDPRL